LRLLALETDGTVQSLPLSAVLRFLNDLAVPFHQQSGRTRRAHDEASSKNLRRLPIVARCDGLRANPLPSTARKQGWNIMDAISCDPGPIGRFKVTSHGFHCNPHVKRPYAP
jgi:hypothetical protein